MNNDSGETVEGTNYFSCRHSQQQREPALTNYFSGENVLQDRKVNYRFTFAMEVATFLCYEPRFINPWSLFLSSSSFFSFLSFSSKERIRYEENYTYTFTRRNFFLFTRGSSFLPARTERWLFTATLDIFLIDPKLPFFPSRERVVATLNLLISGEL